MRRARSRRCPDVVRRIGWPADVWGWLAAVVIRAAATGEAAGVPPVQETAAVRVPAAGRGQPLEEMGTAGVGRPPFATDRVAAGHKGEHEPQAPGPARGSHAVSAWDRFGCHGVIEPL